MKNRSKGEENDSLLLGFRIQLECLAKFVLFRRVSSGERLYLLCLRDRRSRGGDLGEPGLWRYRELLPLQHDVGSDRGNNGQLQHRQCIGRPVPRCLGESELAVLGECGLGCDLGAWKRGLDRMVQHGFRGSATGMDGVSTTAHPERWNFPARCFGDGPEWD